MSLGSKAQWLVELGRQEAPAAVAEAIAIRRQLAVVQPDPFKPELAGWLSNQSVWLSAVGRMEEALTAIGEAVTIFRELAVALPGVFLPQLARALLWQGSVLTDQPD